MKSLAIFFLAVGMACAQPTNCLTTTFASNNGQSGNMFDIVALTDVTIQCFDVNLDSGTWDLEVYAVTGGGTFVGNEAIAANWTLLATVTGLASAGPDLPTALGVGLGVQILAGQTQGFYVTVTNGTSMNYTNGSTAGTVFASDANIQFLEGAGKSYPFGATFSPRVWNGNICYDTGLVGPSTSCPIPVIPCPNVQSNSADFSFDLDGNNTGTATSVARTVKCENDLTFANWTSALAGGFWDCAIALGAAANPGLLSSPNCQVINVDFLAGGTPYWLSTGTQSLSPPVPLPWTGNLSLPFLAPPAPVLAHAQSYITNPANPDGFTLSAPVEIESLPVTSGPSIVLTLGDDNFVELMDTGTTFGCNTFTGFPAVNFYGTTYNSVFVNSNGGVGLTGGDADFSATSAEFLSGNARVANIWTDLRPNASGTVTAAALPTGIQVDFVGVETWAGGPGNGTSNTSTCIIDANGVTISNYIPEPTSTTAMVVGITPGGGATGVAVSWLGLMGAGLQAGLATDAVYEENIAGSVPGGFTSINFPLADGSAYIVN